MNRNELVDAVAGKAELSKTAASKAVEAVFDSITRALQEGGEVRLVGFGTFSVARRAASEGRNPRTDEKIKIATWKPAKFKPGARANDREITPLRAAVILYIFRNQGVTEDRMGSVLGTEPIVLHRVIDELCAEDLLERRVDPNDSRVRALWLTSCARPVVNQILGVGYAVREHELAGSGRDHTGSAESETVLREQWSPEFSARLLQAFRGAVTAELRDHITAGRAAPGIRSHRQLILTSSDGGQ